MNNLPPQKSVVERVGYSPVSRANATFMSRVYLWMAIGILITGSISYQVAKSPDLVMNIVDNRFIFIGLVAIQLVAVVALSGFIRKLSALAAAFIYLGYTALTGLTLSVIFLVFTLESIAMVFFLTAFSFAGLSVFGYLTKRDLTGVGSFCIMGLFGLIGISLLGFFIPNLLSNATQLAMAVIGVIIFAGLTAYDTQKIKAYNVASASADDIQKSAIHGALALYLDFINLFLQLLRLFGRRR